MPKVLTTEERTWLKCWAYAYESGTGRGLKAVAHRMGYNSRVWLSKVLNDTGEGGEPPTSAIDEGPWKRLLNTLLSDGDEATFFEDEAASGGTIRDLRTQRRRLRAKAEREARHPSPEPQRGVVEVTA